jgi:hypothetical protein
MATRWTVPYKKAVLEFARLFGNTADTCREFGVSRSPSMNGRTLLGKGEPSAWFR